MGGDVVRKAVLVAALLALMAVAAEAQVYVEYSRRTRDSSLRITYGGGYYYGYGYGGYYGAGTRYCVPRGGYGYPGYAPYPGGEYGGYGQYYYSGPVYPPYYARYTVMDYSPPRPAARGGAADRSPAAAAAREVEEGRRRFRLGDYRGAVDAFREAVAADTSGAAAQAWFALALGVTGDYRNADKALRSAAERAAFGKIDLKDLFRDAKERARVLGVLAKAAGEGALTAAWVQSLEGDPARLKQLADKDAAAKRLLAP